MNELAELSERLPVLTDEPADLISLVISPEESVVYVASL